MKNKIPYILLIAVIIIGIAIVAKGTHDKNAEKEDNKNYAQSIKDNSEVQKNTEVTYEFYQTDPESGLAVIYTFRIYPEKDGIRSGNITVDGAGRNVILNCAVKSTDTDDTFLFSYYDENSDNMGEFETGDALVCLHRKEKEIIPEFIKLTKVYPKGEIIRNY